MRAAQRAILDAELAFPARIKIAVPPDGLGQRLDAMQRWLDENAGSDGWTIMPAGTHGVMNDALAIYFMDAVLAGAFVARWCAANRAGGTGADEGAQDAVASCRCWTSLTRNAP